MKSLFDYIKTKAGIYSKNKDCIEIDKDSVRNLNYENVVN